VKKVAILERDVFLYYHRRTEFRLGPKWSLICNKIIDHVLHFRLMLNFVIHA